MVQVSFVMLPLQREKKSSKHSFAVYQFAEIRHPLIFEQNDSLPSCWIQCYTNWLAYFLWFTCGANEGLSVVLTSIHTNNLCICKICTKLNIQLLAIKNRITIKNNLKKSKKYYRFLLLQLPPP